MAQKQKGLLLSASRLLKKGGALVYSTCTFAPEENEAAIDWVLKKTGGAMEVLPFTLKDIGIYPAVLSWGKKNFSPQISSCVRMLPTAFLEGFFIAKLKKADG